MRVPYEYFLRYLISLGHDYESINRSLETYGFETVIESYVTRLRAEMAIPEDFQPKVESHGLSMAWLKQQKIHSLWYRDKLQHINEAFAVLGKPAIRKMVDTLTLAPIPYTLISELIKKRFKQFVSPAAIESYTLYFNNFSILSPEESENYIKQRRQYWKLAALNGDVDLIKFHLGLDTQVASAKIVEDTLTLAYHKVREMRYMPNSMETAKAFASYLPGIQWGIEERKTMADNIEDLLSHLTLNQTDLDDPVMEGDAVISQLPGELRED